MKYYNTKAYAVEKSGQTKYIADIIVEEGKAIPLIGNKEVTDTASKFSYAILEETKEGEISGQRKDIIDQAGFDIGVYKNDLTPSNYATPEQIVTYHELFPVSKISDKQDELKFELKLSQKSSTPRNR